MYVKDINTKDSALADPGFTAQGVPRAGRGRRLLTQQCLEKIKCQSERIGSLGAPLDPPMLKYDYYCSYSRKKCKKSL